VSAEPVVLVPGLLCTGDLFGPQRAWLEASGRAAIVADHTRDETVAGIATRLLAAAPERFALAGLSMGGYVALEVMRRAPARVTRLALLDTSARADTPAQTARRHELVAQAEGGDFAGVKDALWPLFVRPARHADAALKARVVAMMDATGPAAFVRQERAITSRPDGRAGLADIEVPTLVLVGADDALTPPDLAREIGEAIEWASVTVVPDSGHLATLESPEVVNRALGAWLAA
jgi:pimeloyl-ACP methyl ester carboxylesterase